MCTAANEGAIFFVSLGTVGGWVALAMSAYIETMGDVDWMKWEEVKVQKKKTFLFFT